MRLRRLRSLRARLLVGVIALAAVCLVVLGAVVYAQQRDFLIGNVDEQLQGSIPQVNRQLADEGIADPDAPASSSRGDGIPGGGDGLGGPPPGGDAVGGGGRGGRRPGPTLPPGTYGARISASGANLGAIVFGFADDAPSPPRLPSDLRAGRIVTASSTDGSASYRVFAGRIPGGRTLTVAAIPLTGVDDQLQNLLLVEAAVIGVVLLLMGGLGFWVVRIGLRPLDRIGATAGAIAAGDLSQRVEPAEPGTEVGRLGLSLNAMLHQIEGAFSEREESEQRLRRFLADASHELRTPLASIRGYAELYRMGAARDPEGAEKAMSRIEQEAARMGVLVEDLLVLARLDEIREQVREPVDLSELARDAADDARAAARDREITFASADEDTLVLGDGDQLRQVLLNLTRNALVHTPAGTPVALTVSGSGSSVRVVVRDHGPGLPHGTDSDELFERFWRAEAATGRGRGPAGAGLGLAIVHGIVTAHGGTVHATNAPDGGAQFTVELPALSSEPEPPRTPASPRS